ncbi:hypothetical protein HMPREF0833_11373 [Streptococcus parasanguinis ATCC 15912]|uniref:Uncharacterized protein n=1 Tax=Streptococcus parasanguinis (strain ATCC 15912 / DSM 6778 / CIP 104372 / LMG 14537) TaxID=760570 RepID=F8DKM5_STREP|nr:hypothetical protein HMPREF0833_11373 [Streptococcus parasanguinis ATCC 15912]
MLVYHYFLRVFTFYNKRKRLKKIVQNGLFLQSEKKQMFLFYY